MKIEHLAIWVKNLEAMKTFYCKYFHLTANDLYQNPKKNFSSYFLSFDETSCRIELMHKPEISEQLPEGLGFTHIAISVGSAEKVNELTEKLRNDGYTIHSEPRTTGDGYYESVILDPEGNAIELTI